MQHALFQSGKEIYGFLVNRILTAMLDEALFPYDLGVASYQDIDTAVKGALGHPLGPSNCWT